MRKCADCDGEMRRVEAGLEREVGVVRLGWYRHGNAGEVRQGSEG